MIYASPPYLRCWQNLEFSASITLECYLATKLYFILNHIVNFWDLNWPSKQFALKISINNRILRPTHRTKSCWIVIRFAKLRMMKRDSVKPPGTLVRIEAKPEAVPEVCATPTSCSMEEIFFCVFYRFTACQHRERRWTSAAVWGTTWESICLWCVFWYLSPLWWCSTGITITSGLALSTYTSPGGLSMTAKVFTPRPYSVYIFITSFLFTE